MNRKHRPKQTLPLVFGISLVLLSSACASSAPTVPSTPAVATSAAPTLAPTIPPPATATAQLEQVTFAGGPPYPGMVGYLPTDVAQALGLFKQEGLNVNIEKGLSRDDADYALFTGDVDFAVLGIDQPIFWHGKSKEEVMVAEFTRFPGITLLVRSDLKAEIGAISDLKKKEIGSPDGLGTLMSYVVTKGGLGPQDAILYDSGGVVSEVGDLQAGNLVGAVELDPWTTELTQPGTAFALVDLATEADSTKWLGGEYPYFGLVTRADVIQNRPATVQKMTNALVKAVRFITTHNAADIAAILPDDVTGPDRSLYIAGLQHTLPSFSPDGLINEAGVMNAIEANKGLGKIKPDAQIDAGTLYTNDFVNAVK